MLSLKEFGKLAESYGTDLARWPEEKRSEAMILLRSSPDARAIRDEMRALDDAIAAATEREDRAFWQPGEQIAALARLRAGVGSRIASPSRESGTSRGAADLTGRIGGLFMPKPGWMGLTASGAFAIVFGLMIGVTSSPSPTTDNVFAMLQPAPIQMLAEQDE